MNDLDLLRQYAQQDSEEAFATLVNRHLKLVYVTALRHVRSPQLAEEVAQSVFMSLARNASAMNPGTILTAWLYRVTRHAAIDLMRGESRRQLREQTAFDIANMKSESTEWKHIEPFLDEALEALDETDRNAILLRYFENKSLRQVGEALGMSEDGAQKRVSRAIDQLRAGISKRGVAVGTASLVAVLCAQAAQAAPIGLNTAISAAVSLSGAAVHTATTIGITKAIAMTTIQKTLIVATLAAAVGTGIYEVREASRLRDQVQTLSQQQLPLAGQIRQLQNERDDAARQLAALRDENERLNRDRAELPRLRGEVARFRSDSQKLAQLKTAKDQQDDVQREAPSKPWIDRWKALRQYLDQNPKESIPEIQFANESAWLNSIQKDLKTEQDLGNAAFLLRNQAQMKFSGFIGEALRQYKQANNDQFPSDLSQLLPYCDPAVGSTMTGLYEIVPASVIQDTNSNVTGDWIITRKVRVNPTSSTRLAVFKDGERAWYDIDSRD